MNATHHARYVSNWDAGARTEEVQVDFTTRSGSTETVNGPVRGGSLPASTRRRPRGVLHPKDVLTGQAVCESVGLEFWAISDNGPLRYWATKDGQFFFVHHVPQRAIVTVHPVDAWGRSAGDVVEHPATEAVR